MSFEGYYQCMCKNGHNWTEELYGLETEAICPKCSEKVYWWNLINITNGSYEYDEKTKAEFRIDGYIELTPKSRKVCEHCSSVLEEIYYIPIGKGHLINSRKSIN